MAGHDGGRALARPASFSSFSSTPPFFLPVHTCAAVRVPGGNWRPHQQDLTLPLPESECPEPGLMKAN